MPYMYEKTCKKVNLHNYVTASGRPMNKEGIVEGNPGLLSQIKNKDKEGATIIKQVHQIKVVISKAVFLLILCQFLPFGKEVLAQTITTIAGTGTAGAPALIQSLEELFIELSKLNAADVQKCEEELKEVKNKINLLADKLLSGIISWYHLQ